MYITSLLNNKIVRANLDGSSPLDLGNPGGLLSGPNDIALDLANGQMYITSTTNHKIVRANLDGSARWTSAIRVASSLSPAASPSI